MTYGSNQKGEAILTLSPEEHEQFKQLKRIQKVTSYSKWCYRITVKMTRLKRQPKY